MIGRPPRPLLISYASSPSSSSTIPATAPDTADTTAITVTITTNKSNTPKKINNPLSVISTHLLNSDFPTDSPSITHSPFSGKLFPKNILRRLFPEELPVKFRSAARSSEQKSLNIIRLRLSRLPLSQFPPCIHEVQDCAPYRPYAPADGTHIHDSALSP